MPKLRVHNLSISLDGYVAGPAQGPDHPLGVDGEELHTWLFDTDYGRLLLGQAPSGERGIDQDYAEAGDANIGASIMGRNMFSPSRGDWQDLSWAGWWGPNPPYHHDVFVVTHYPPPDLDMEGGTVFRFTDDPLCVVLKRAFAAAGGRDVRLAGGAGLIRQYLQAGLVDEMHLAQVPILLNAGERLYDGLGRLPGYECSRMESTPAVTHLTFSKIAR